MSYNSLFYRNKNIAISEQISCKFVICDDNVDKYLVSGRLRSFNITYSRLSDKIYKAIIPIKDNNYVISELPVIQLF